MSNNNKRLRTANWTNMEKEILMNIIYKSINVIDSKKNDTMSNVAKKRAWEYITDRFNTLSDEMHRSATQIQQQWRTMKITAKRKLMKSLQQTGCASLPPQDYQHSRVLDMMPQEFNVNGFYCSEYDATAAQSSSQEATEYDQNQPDTNICDVEFSIDDEIGHKEKEESRCAEEEESPTQDPVDTQTEPENEHIVSEPLSPKKVKKLKRLDKNPMSEKEIEIREKLVMVTKNHYDAVYQLEVEKEKESRELRELKKKKLIQEMELNELIKVKLQAEIEIAEMTKKKLKKTL